MVRDLCSKRTAADKIMNKMNENRKIVLDTLNEQNIEYEMFEHQAVYTQSMKSKTLTCGIMRME